ncbi:MAG: cytidine deaminase [Candidatus Nanopelagicales bacterium]
MTQAALPGDEDRKLITLARAARARTQADSGGAVRDDTGRSYAGADVNLPSLTLTGLEVAVAQAVSAGARGIEGAAVVGDREVPIDVVRDAGGSGVPVWRADRSGVP